MHGAGFGIGDADREEADDLVTFGLREVGLDLCGVEGTDPDIAQSLSRGFQHDVRAHDGGVDLSPVLAIIFPHPSGVWFSADHEYDGRAVCVVRRFFQLGEALFALDHPNMDGLLVGSRRGQAGGIHDVVNLGLRQGCIFEGPAGITISHKRLESTLSHACTLRDIREGGPVVDVRHIGQFL